MLKTGDRERSAPMGDLDIITGVFVVVDEWIKPLAVNPEPGPPGKLSMSELFSCLSR